MLATIPAPELNSLVTVLLLFLLASLVTIVMHAMGKCPLWVPVVLLWVAVAVLVLPAK